MAVGHYAFNPNTTHGGLLRRALDQQEKGLEDLNDCLATMAQMIDGDGSDPAQFTYLTGKFGFETNASAKAAWDELNSLASKLNTNAQVTSVNAALLQAFNKFR